MPPRKDRVPIVIDTNILLTHFTSMTRRGFCTRVVRLWRDEHRFQLIVSQPVVTEYLELLARKNVAPLRIERFADLLVSPIVTHVNLGRRVRLSRDPDDDVMLDTALAGRARYVVTHDGDLLNIPASKLQPFRFSIVRAGALLAELGL